MTEVSFTVNGRPYRITVEPRTLLSDALRQQCSLTGTHVGCEHGVCGACTVLADGEPVRSCLMLAVQADGREFTTVEGLGTPGRLSALQETFRAEHGLQCGFCTPGILLTLEEYLTRHPEATEPELRGALSGNLCRCTGYQNIVTAALRAAGRPRGRARAQPRAEKPPWARRFPGGRTCGCSPAPRRSPTTSPVTGAVHAYFLRSPHAHARIIAIDADAARAADGVLGVFTGSDLAQWTLPARIAPPIDGLAPQVVETLPTAKVRFAGDPVAVVVATDRYRAEDAAALIRVEYEPLEPVLDAAESLACRAALVDDSLESNVVFREQYSAGDVAAAFLRAHRVVRTRFSHQRMTHAPMETRGCVARWDAGRGELVMHTGTQVPHPYRTQLAARLRLGEDQVRVIVPDVGGAFGQKLVVHREDLTVAALAMQLNRPVCWREDRIENLTARRPPARTAPRLRPR